MALTPISFGTSGLDFGNNDIVFDRDTGRFFRVGDLNDNIFNDNINGTPFSQEFSERRIRSGAANPTTRISNTGDNVNICAPVQQIANTGNVANEQGVITGPGVIPAYGSRVDDFGFVRDGVVFLPDNDERFFILDDRDGRFDDIFDRDFNRNGDIDFEGSSINIDGSLSSECTQTISQAAAAGPGAAATAGGAVATAGGAVAAAPPGGGPVAVAAPAAAPVVAVAAPAGPPAGVVARAGGGMLPSTGGPAITSVLALSAGVLLVGGGLLAYRRFMH
jgi:LPXTG-motif cell wall-anchored protein